MELKTYVAQDSTGAVLAGAVASLYLNGTNTLATGLVDPGGNPINNPMTTDANGVVTFSAPNGIYQLQFTLGPVQGPAFTIQLLDLNEQIEQVNNQVSIATELVDEAKLILDANVYATLNDGLGDANLPVGSIFRIVGTTTTGAFLYYRKNSSYSATYLAAIPTAAQVSTLNTALANVVTFATFNASVKKIDPLLDDGSLLYCVRDVNGFHTWLGVRKSDGGPSEHAERMIRDRLKINIQANFIADGEEICWAVTDSAGNLTDLAIRQRDGQLADYAVRRIGARIASSIEENVNAQINAMSIGRDAPGFQTLASMTRWAAKRGRGESVTSPITFNTPTNNQAARLQFPSPYAKDDPMLLVIYFGGVGSGSTLTPPTEYAAANDDGIIWARCNFEGDHYGSPKAMQDVAEVYATACKMAPVGGVMLLGNSMGGMGALNALLTKAVPGVLGLYLTDPVCNLWDRYNSERQGLIQTAYGIASNGADYSTKTAGYDPVLRNWTDFRGVPVYCIASSGDTLVPFETNAKQLYDTFGQHLDFTLIDKGTAGHNAADRFDVTALRAFMRVAANGKILLN